MSALLRHLHVPPRSPQLHALTRFIQAFITLCYTGLLLYSYFNSGWWLNIKLPMELGSIAVSLTLLYTSLFILRRPFDFAEPRYIHTLFPASMRGHAAIVYLLVIVELGFSTLWVMTAVTMCFKKGKDFKLLFARPPYGTWVGGIVLGGIEGLTFLWSAYVMWRERQGTARNVLLWGVELNEEEAAARYARV